MVKTKPKNKPKKGKKKKGRKAAEPGLSLKEQLAQKRQADRLRKEFISFTASALGFALLMGGLAAIAGGLKAAVGAIVAILTISLSFKYPRQALWSFLIYLPLGGTVIYALGNSPILQLAKEGFYIPALLGVVQYCRRE